MEFDGTLVFVMISFLVFMVLMRQIYFEPIRQLKIQREAKMNEDRKHTDTFAREFERLAREYEAGLVDARKHAQEVIAGIRQDAKQSASETLTKTREEAMKELSEKMEELAQWREEAYAQLAPDRENIAATIVHKVSAGKAAATSS